MMRLEIRHRSTQKKTVEGVKEEIIGESPLALEEKERCEKIVMTTSVVPDSS